MKENIPQYNGIAIVTLTQNVEKDIMQKKNFKKAGLSDANSGVIHDQIEDRTTTPTTYDEEMLFIKGLTVKFVKHILRV